ncbi:MAG: hypothetical protein AAFZ15_22985 [Bacteroidota bacterium]
MKIRQSSMPYLFLLILLLIGIPLVEKVLKNKSEKEAIVIKVNKSLENIASLNN